MAFRRNFVPRVAVTRQKAVPSIELSPATGDCEREKRSGGHHVVSVKSRLQKNYTNTMYLLQLQTPSCDPKHVDEEKPLDDKLPSMVTDAGRDTLAKETMSKRGIIGSQPRGNHNVFIHCPKDPDCEICWKTNTTQARCRINPKTRGDGIAPSTKCRDMITATRQDADTKKAVIVQDDFTNWIQSYPMKTEETPYAMLSSQRFHPLSQKPERIYTDNSR